MMICLGIETSCDETSVGIVTDDQKILAHFTHSQIKEHEIFGGVVPEIAARALLEKIEALVRLALEESRLDVSDIDCIASTAGPGLIGGVAVGTMVAKGLAFASNKPYVAVNHLEGHALTVRLCEDVEFPYLLLLASGGHTQILEVNGVGDYTCLGGTLDDALGETFDKSAKLLGLPYPGGPAIEKLAQMGDPEAFVLPKPLYKRKNCDFSLSGLKTAVREVIESRDHWEGQDLFDLCASLQLTICKIIEDRLTFALNNSKAPTLVVAGGVAANKTIRKTLEGLALKFQKCFVAPPLSLCTDNGAMIAWAGLERFRLGIYNEFDFPIKPRWPLEDLKA